MASKTQPWKMFYDWEIIMQWQEADLIRYKNRALQMKWFIKEEVEKFIILPTKHYKW